MKDLKPALYIALIGLVAFVGIGLYCFYPDPCRYKSGDLPQFRDRVRVVEGFYEGEEGIVAGKSKISVQIFTEDYKFWVPTNTVEEIQ